MPARTPSGHLLQALQNHLWALGHTIGWGNLGRLVPAEAVARQVEKLFVFLRQARAEASELVYHALQIEYCAPVIGEAIVDAGFIHGQQAFGLVMSAVDSALGDPAARIFGWSEFRRRIALRAYNHDNDVVAASNRLEACLAALGNAGTPDKQVHELAKTAEAFANIGRPERAREILKSLHEHTLGYALAPKKDPQYAFWRAVFERACNYDPEGRPERVAFFARLIAGMGATEGRSAAYRLTSTVMRHAARANPNLGARVALLFETEGLTDWTEMVGNLLLGVIERRAELALVATHAWTRLVLPYCREPNHVASSATDFIRSAVGLAPSPQVPEIIQLLETRIESESSAALRIVMLRSLLDAAGGRSVDVSGLEQTLARWYREAPHDREDRSDMSTDIFRNVHSLGQFKERLATDIPPASYYQVFEALLRLLPAAKLADAKALVGAHPNLLADSRVALCVARLALGENQKTYARDLLYKHQPTRGERAYWDSWRGGVKLDYYRCLIELEGNSAREQAFAELARDLSQGREWTWSLLHELPDILDLIAPSTDWAAIWTLLAEQLESFRDYRASDADIPLLPYPTTDEDLIAHLYEAALSLQVAELSRHARAGVIFGRGGPGGNTVLFTLLDRLLNQSGDSPSQGLALIRASKYDDEVKRRYESALQDWISKSDLAFFGVAEELAKFWGKSVILPPHALPTYYSILLEDEGEAERFVPPLGHGPLSKGLTSDDVFDWTWAFGRPLRRLSEAAGLTLLQLRRRCHQFMSEEGGLSIFGADAQTAIVSRLKSLELLLSFNRPQMMAAIRALRRVSAELLQAGRLTQQDVPLLLYELGAPAVGELMIEPIARPGPIPWPDLGNFVYSEKELAWLDAALSDTKPLVFDDETVLFEASYFGRERFGKKIAIERISAHDCAHLDRRSAERALVGIPRAIDTGKAVPAYRIPSRHFVALMRGTELPSIPNYMPVICPLWATRLGWLPHPANRFIYQDRAGTPVARTLWWRDGGPHIQRDHSPHGEGFLLLLTPAGRRQIESLTGVLRVEPLCWRSIQSERQDAALPIRRVGPPGFQ